MAKNTFGWAANISQCIICVPFINDSIPCLLCFPTPKKTKDLINLSLSLSVSFPELYFIRDIAVWISILGTCEFSDDVGMKSDDSAFGCRK